MLIQVLLLKEWVSAIRSATKRFSGHKKPARRPTMADNIRNIFDDHDDEVTDSAQTTVEVTVLLVSLLQTAKQYEVTISTLSSQSFHL